MKSNYLKLQGINIHYYTSGKIDNRKLSLIFLHGFTGDASDWFFLVENFKENYNLIFVDLPGHGKSTDISKPSAFSSSAMCDQLTLLLKTESIDTAVFVGYSMGGRLALQYAVSKPEHVCGLFLESTTPGIESDYERETRYNKDLELTDKIKNEGINNFIDHWFDQPLFESLKNIPQNKMNEIIQKRKQNSAEGLINSLKGFSQGIMPPAWENLPGIKFPVLLVSGNLDYKFKKINSAMHTITASSEHSIIDGAGHNTHLEKPEEFIILLSSFLRTLNSKKIV